VGGVGEQQGLFTLTVLADAQPRLRRVSATHFAHQPGFEFDLLPTLHPAASVSNVSSPNPFSPASILHQSSHLMFRSFTGFSQKTLYLRAFHASYDRSWNRAALLRPPHSARKKMRARCGKYLRDIDAQQTSRQQPWTLCSSP